MRMLVSRISRLFWECLFQQRLSMNFRPIAPRCHVKNTTRKPLTLLVLLTIGVVSSSKGLAQGPDESKRESTVEITPARMGFTAESLQLNGESVQYYLSTEGRPVDRSRKLPLVLYLDGSGPTPIYAGNSNRLTSSLMYDARDFPSYHYVAIGKPGLKFHESKTRIESEKYDRLLTLRWRVDAANAVLNHLAKQEFVVSNRMLVIGHSEGADVAPWVAKECKHVTHVAGLAPGGVSQMFDFIIFIRKQVAAGEISVAEGDRQVQQYKSDYAKIFADPKSTTKKWLGETYLRWSTFFRPSMDAWCELEKPVYLGICRDDRNTPAESGEAIELEFIRRGKTNLTSKVWPCDHHFVEVPREEGSEPVDRRLDALKEILAWAKR